MIISALFIVDMSSALIIVLGFLTVWQKGKLARLGGIRGNINKLRGVSYFDQELMLVLYSLKKGRSSFSHVSPICSLFSIYSSDIPIYLFQPTGVYSYAFNHQMVNEMTLENDKLTASNDKFQLENDKYVFGFILYINPYCAAASVVMLKFTIVSYHSPFPHHPCPHKMKFPHDIEPLLQFSPLPFKKTRLCHT